MSLHKSSRQKSLFNIAQAYRGFVEEPVPSALFDVIESGASKKIVNITVVAIAFLAGVVLMLLIKSFNTDKSEIQYYNLPAENLALSSHNVLATDVVHPVQVYADDMNHLNEWLSYRVGKSLSVKVLTAAGFSLIGANLIPDGTYISSLIVYENGEKERLSLFTRYKGGNEKSSEPIKDHSHGANALHWQQNGVHKVLVSSVSHRVLENVYLELQR